MCTLSRSCIKIMKVVEAKSAGCSAEVNQRNFAATLESMMNIDLSDVPGTSSNSDVLARIAADSSIQFKRDAAKLHSEIQTLQKELADAKEHMKNMAYNHKQELENQRVTLLEHSRRIQEEQRSELTKIPASMFLKLIR
eukprot:719274_1